MMMRLHQLPSSSGNLHNRPLRQAGALHRCPLAAYQICRPRCQASANDFSRKAQNFAEDAQRRAGEFFEKQRIQEKAQAASKTASKKFRETYEVVEDNVKRAASTVDSKYDVSGKAQKAASRIREEAEDVDSKFGIRRRLRIIREDVVRNWPRWRRQYGEFSRTPLGRVSFFAVLFYLLYSGIAFRLLNILFLFYWILPIFLVPLINRQMAAEARRQQEAQQAAANPFNSFFRAQQARAQQPRASPFSGGAAKKRDYNSADGPVIDAEWTTIDEGDRK